MKSNHRNKKYIYFFNLASFIVYLRSKKKRERKPIKLLVELIFMNFDRIEIAIWPYLLGKGLGNVIKMNHPANYLFIKRHYFVLWSQVFIRTILFLFRYACFILPLFSDSTHTHTQNFILFCCVSFISFLIVFINLCFDALCFMEAS